MGGPHTTLAALRWPCDTCPAVPAALALAAGVQAALAWQPRPAAVAASLAWAALGLAITLIVTPWRRWRLLCLPIGMALLVIHDLQRPDAIAHALPRPACRASLTGVVRDAGCHSDLLDDQAEPAAIVVAITRLRLPGQPADQPADERVMAAMPRGTRIAYGDRVALEGIFLPESPPACPEAFDYRAYLRNQGLDMLFKAHAVQPLGPPQGLDRLTRALLDLRDRLADRLVSNLTPGDHAGVLLAMTFGFRQTMPASVRDAFLRSGAIHVFSVSGLHVGIVAAVLGALLYALAVPYRWRHAVLPIAVGAYVLMTGAAPPAVRAWLMISVLSWSRACLVAIAPLNGVALAAIILIGAQPRVINQAGFLYSFITVSILILGWPLLTTLAADLCERQLWRPRRQRSQRLMRLVRGTTQAVGTSLLAWFGGSGLMLHLSGMIVPAALPVNVALVVVANLLIVLALPKILLACLPWTLPDRLAAAAMDALLESIDLLVTCGSAPAGSWAVPAAPAWLTALYYALLFAALAPRLPAACRRLSMALTVALLAVAVWAPWHRPALALVWGADCDVPVVALERPDRLPPVVLHAGTPDAYRTLDAWLRLRGHRRADALIVPWDARRAAAAATTATRALQPDTLVLPESTRAGSYLDRATRLQLQRGGRLRRLRDATPDGPAAQARWPGGAIRVETTPERRRFTLTAGRQPHLVDVRIDARSTGPCHLQLRRNGIPIGHSCDRPRHQRRLITLTLDP